MNYKNFVKDHPGQVRTKRLVNSIRLMRSIQCRALAGVLD